MKDTSVDGSIAESLVARDFAVKDTIVETRELLWEQITEAHEEIH